MDPRDKELLRIALEARRNGGQTNTPGPPPGLWLPPQQGAGYPPYPQGYPPALPAPQAPELADSPENRIIDRLLQDDGPPPDGHSQRERRSGGLDLVDVLFWGFTLACLICLLLTSGELWSV